MFTCDNLGVNSAGHLTFAGQDTADLAARYGTPLYLMDEERIRHNCRVYLDAMRRHFGAGSRPLYAGKANCFTQMYRIMASEGMGVDVVSCGEIHTAAKAGYDLANAYFHGNCKTDADIAYAMERGVGYFVADSAEELAAIDAEAAKRGKRQQVLLRLTPGIDTHTYAAVNTGKVDSKFGAAIETGQAAELTAAALGLSHIDLVGFHCHVGSQVFAEDVFERAAVILLEFIAAMRNQHGYTARQLDLGGGYGVRYVEDDPVLDIAEKIGSVAAVIHEACARLDIPEPAILMEPGRSIVADAGLTLYTVGAVKRIPGYKNYVAIDGGMGDNPRFALYRSRYTVLPAGNMDAPRPFVCSVVGRCCESGDIIQENVPMPEDIRRGDVVAVCTTGAYNYSMASDYNRLPRPPIVMLRGGESYVAVRRETFDDLTALDRTE
ncbi:MAG: diaminopimelate decarboxylase [Oscillospiraceae bacterium]|nr:diaminopimelate decarboxylase [Oscillospiraceae bacterium]